MRVAGAALLMCLPHNNGIDMVLPTMAVFINLYSLSRKTVAK